MSIHSKKPRPLDRTDRKILECLQQNGKISNVALAKKVSLTTTPCFERVRRLERDGYILGYTARLKPEFEARNVKVIGLSVDPLDSHAGWAKDIEETLAAFERVFLQNHQEDAP